MEIYGNKLRSISTVFPVFQLISNSFISTYFYRISIYFNLFQSPFSPHRLKQRHHEHGHHLDNHTSKHGYCHRNHDI